MSEAGLVLVAEPYDGPGGRVLRDAVQQEYVRRYGGPDATPLDPAEFAPPGGRFLLAYDAGTPVACGGVRLLPAAGAGVAEIKRMYVRPDARRNGIARRLLAALEAAALDAGCTRVWLETGSRQPEAVGLYESSGYTPIEPYGYYRCEPDSRCYAKTLVAAEKERSELSRPG